MCSHFSLGYLSESEINTVAKAWAHLLYNVAIQHIIHCATDLILPNFKFQFKQRDSQFLKKREFRKVEIEKNEK